MASEFLIVARKIFEIKKKPMHPKEIVSEGMKQRLFSDKIAGKTPHQTMKSKLSVNIRQLGEKSEFVRTYPGIFYLRKLLQTEQEVYDAPPLKIPTSDEDVLLFKSDILNSKERFQGIKKTWKQIFKRLSSSGVCLHKDRISAETDSSHKQILTYVMVTRKGSILAYRRGRYNRVEDYLRGSQCIGFGGHVILKDKNLFALNGMGVLNGTIRELLEELNLPPKDRLRLSNEEGLNCVGVLNDDSSIVGQRHFAFLFQYEVSDDVYWENPIRGEKSITQLRWLDTNSNPTPIWLFEYWSQLCLREYFPNLVNTLSAFRLIRKKTFRSPHILCLLGEVGSGKSEATKLFCDRLGYKEINTGNIVSNLIGLPPIPKTPRDVFQEEAWKFITTKNGPKKLAKAIDEQSRKLNCPKIVIDGIRQEATLNELRKLTKTNFAILFIHTLPDLAYNFYKTREPSDISIFDFLKIRRAKVESEVESMISISDAVVYNWKGKKSYLNMIHHLFNSFP